MLPLIASFAALVLLASDPVPWVNFVRTVPAGQNPSGAENVCVLYRIGDSRTIETFVEQFVEQSNKSGTIVATTVPANEQHMVGDAPPDTPHGAHIRRLHPADLYVGVKEFSCGLSEKSGERSVHDADGKRVPSKYVWIEALCQARIDLVSAATITRTSSFYVRGQGASSRVETVGAEEREAALFHAARSAAISATEQIAPRRIRDRLELDPDAPDFDRAYAFVNAGQLEDARALWQRALPQFGKLGALHYDLAALNEALGDVETAQKHYAEAHRLAPANDRYRRAADAFERRKRKPPPAAGAEREQPKPSIRSRTF